MEVLRFLKKHHLDPERFLRYLDRVSERTEDRYATLFELYRDYLEAAYALGRCMEHSKVIWPEDLNAAHDAATAELAVKQAREEKKRRAASLKERRLKYEFELDGLKIVFPATGLAIPAGGTDPAPLCGRLRRTAHGGRDHHLVPPPDQMRRPPHTSLWRWTATSCGRSTDMTTRGAPARRTPGG